MIKKEMGFTLIELLAVIVILAIIALIAVPIILGIINDSKNSADKRSIELYGKAVENAIANYLLTNNKDENITLEKIKSYIKYNGSKVECETTNLNKNGTVYLEGCKVGGKELDYIYGENNKICILEEGTDKTVGSKYTCTLDKERTFYVLENNEPSETITLLMDRNYTDDEVPIYITWCAQSGPNPRDNKCNHDGLDPYIEKIQAKFGNKVTVGIPSYEQMTAIGCTSTKGTCPQWAYDYLYETPNLVTGVKGYWTSTDQSSSYQYAWYVHYSGYLNITSVCCDASRGIRPIIIVPKSSF